MTSRHIVLALGLVLLSCGSAGENPTAVREPVVSVSPANYSLFPGNSLTLSATLNGVAAEPSAFVWTSSDTTVATVSGSGVVHALRGSPGVNVCAALLSSSTTRGCAVVVVLVKGTP